MTSPRCFLAFVCAAAAIFSAACSNSGSDNFNQPPPPVTISISPATAAIATGASSAPLQVTLANDTAVTWTVNGVPNGDATTGTLATSGLQATYTAPAGPTGLLANITATSVADTTKSASAIVYVVPPGTITPTGNTLVATYSITPPSDAQLFVNFGPDTTYGRETSKQPTPAGGGPVSTFVAGMRASTPYHFQGVVQFTDGTTFTDADQIFTTGALPPALVIPITASTTAGMTPQPGIEMLDLLAIGGTVATDLDGSVIWYYPYNEAGGTLLQPIRALDNGHFLLLLAPNSGIALSGMIPPTATNEIREVDLAGNTIRSLLFSDLNTKLSAPPFNINSLLVHHDVIVTPNGHWIFLVALKKDFTDLPGLPGVTTVLGDAIVDVDSDMNPVWTWNTFDHLDINRQPFGFPDWTHANALNMTSDGNLLLSIRHQNWIIKIDYNNGAGTGDIIWHLGVGGEFTLVGGSDPIDWFSTQHGPDFFTAASTGTFDLGVMDNGDARAYPGGETCQTAGFTVCPHTAVPIYHIDETAMTATLVFDDVLSQYSNFGGNITALANGNVEFDLCSDTTAPGGIGAAAFEVTRTATPQVVWKLNVTTKNAYRAFRMPSLYPGVQW